MKRILVVKNNVVVNVLAFDDAADVPLRLEDCDLTTDPTGTTNVGDAIDQRDIVLDRFDTLVFKELLRLTNAVRALQVPPLQPITALDYRSFLKTRM